MKTVISLPDYLLAAVDRVAQEYGMSRKAVFQRAVREFLWSHDDQSVTDSLNDVYSTEDSSLDPVLAQLQWRTLAALPKEDWE